MLSSSFIRLLAAAIIVSSTAIPEKRAPLATVYSSCTVDKSVALTFDDGPYIYLQTIVDELTAAGAKGTFFFNGNNFDCIYNQESVDRVKYAFDRGHQVASHTWSHASLPDLTSDQILDSLNRTDEAIMRITGARPSCMRPPFGNFDDHVLAAVFQRNQNGSHPFFSYQWYVLWDKDTEDADGATVDYSKSVYIDAVNQNLPNMLFLNHETRESTAKEVVPFAIGLLQSRGYKLVTIAECLGLKPYITVGDPEHGTHSCDNTPGPGQGCSGSQCQTGLPPLQTGPAVNNQAIHPGASNSKCLAAPTNADAAPVVITDCDGSASQSWKHSGSNLVIYGNKCLDVPGGSTTNGVKMQIYTCFTGNTNQQFAVTGDKHIAFTGKGQCLDLPNGSLDSGNVVQMWQCTANNNNQVWNFG